jgi:hypothetical protein
MIQKADEMLYKAKRRTKPHRGIRGLTVKSGQVA